MRIPKEVMKSKIKTPQIKKTNLFHQTLKILKEENIKKQSVLVAVSGGVDSLALLHILKQCASLQELKLYSAFIHHGLSPDKKIVAYRDKAQAFVSQVSASYNIPFLTSSPSAFILKNEAEAREFRYNELKKRMQENKIPILALAHNNNDVLETRLIHLIRGCSEKGFHSLKVFKAPYFRPFLHTKREDILEYLKVHKLSFLEDPSNKEDHFLRNWIRLKWLPLLEKKRTGSVHTLSRSLSQIALKEPEDAYSKLITPEGLKRDLFLELSPYHQRGALAHYMRQKKCRDYGLNHINEILKHLDRGEKNFNLRLLKKEWKMSPQFISIEN